jgi:DNA-binding NarL/FixJ family response regulator
MPKSVEVILLEDHPLYREGLASYMRSKISNVNIVYSGGDFTAARNVAAELNIDLAVVDLNLGDGKSPGEIVSTFTSLGQKVLVLSALSNFESVKSSFSMGASGFVSKDAPIEEIGKAIAQVLSGKAWISPVLEESISQNDNLTKLLSKQEFRAIILYAAGLKLDVVARRMNLASSTVKQYIDRAKNKLAANGTKVSTKTEIYKYLRDQGFMQ